MKLKIYFKKIASTLFISFFAAFTFARQYNGKSFSITTDKIAIASFEWNLDETGQTADAQITITNSSKLEITSVKIYLIAENKKGVRLTNPDNQTLCEHSLPVSIQPNQTRSLRFTKAFINNDIAVLKLTKIIVTFKNGSLEILTTNKTP